MSLVKSMQEETFPPPLLHTGRRAGAAIGVLVFGIVIGASVGTAATYAAMTRNSCERDETTILTTGLPLTSFADAFDTAPTPLNGGRPLLSSSRFIRFLPSQADGRLYAPTYANAAQLAMTPALGSTLGRLAILLPGSFGVPQQYTYFTEAASAMGFHALTLMWQIVPTNEAALSLLCSTEQRCGEVYRTDVFGTGSGVDDIITVQPYSTIVARVASSLRYLDSTYPNAGWGQYLHSSGSGTPCVGAVMGICWGKVTLVGYSQSSSPAAWAAFELPIDRVALIGGPQRVWGRLGRSLKASSIGGLVQFREGTVASTRANWAKIGLSGRQELVSSVPISPYNCSAIFVTSVLHHRSDMMDLCLLRVDPSSGVPVSASNPDGVPVNALSAWPVVLGVKLPATQRTIARSASCAAFLEASAENCTDDNWTGILSDLLSPDDVCPESTRYIDIRSGELQVSASNTDANCNSSWGRRFDPTTAVNPILLAAVASTSACTRTVSFLSKVPTTAPIYQDALNGALHFSLTLGTVHDQKMIKWSGVYQGNGGMLNGVIQSPSDCDNFWLYHAPA